MAEIITDCVHSLGNATQERTFELLAKKKLAVSMASATLYGDSSESRPRCSMVEALLHQVHRALEP